MLKTLTPGKQAKAEYVHAKGTSENNNSQKINQCKREKLIIFSLISRDSNKVFKIFNQSNCNKKIINVTAYALTAGYNRSYAIKET
jgi:hypothetical protein